MSKEMRQETSHNVSITYKGIVSKLNGRDGSVMWRSPLKQFSQTPWPGRPLYFGKVNDLVCTEVGHQEIVGLRSSDGSQVWRWQCSPQFVSVLRAQSRRGIFRVYTDADRMYVHSVTDAGNDGEMVALDTCTGSPLWVQKWADANYPFTEVTVAHEILYTQKTTLQGVRILCAFDGTSGQERWRFEEAGASLPPDTGPVAVSLNVVDGIVYHNENPLYALDAQTGKNLWEQRTFCQDCYFNHLIIAKGTVYADTCEGYAGKFPPEFYRVYAFDAKTGKQLWRSESGYTLCTTAWDQKNVILGKLVPSSDEKETYSVLEAHETIGGPPCWQIMIGQRSLFDRMVNDHCPWIEVAEKKLYLLSETQQKILQVFDMSNGQHLMQHTLPLPEDEGIEQIWLRNGMLYASSWKRDHTSAISAINLINGIILWREEIDLHSNVLFTP